MDRTRNARALPIRRSTILSPRTLALASIATLGVAVQVGWLIVVAQGAAVALDWLF